MQQQQGSDFPPKLGKRRQSSRRWVATKYLARTLESKPNAPKLVVGYSSDDVTRGLDSLIRIALFVLNNRPPY